MAGQVIRHNEKPTNIPEYPLTAVRENGDKVRIVTTSPANRGAVGAASSNGSIARGAKWRAFAVLYRSHGHRDKLVDTLKARKIPL